MFKVYIRLLSYKEACEVVSKINIKDDQDLYANLVSNGGVSVSNCTKNDLENIKELLKKYPNSEISSFSPSEIIKQIVADLNLKNA